jgi:signal transduction histidine kinase
VTVRLETKATVDASFRTKLLVAMMLVVSVVAVSTLIFTQRRLAARVRADLEREFQVELSALHALQEFRDAALAERCRILASKPRIHAALEDGALDLLYPSARDELRGIMELEDGTVLEPGNLRARFYRFLDGKGGVIAPAGSSGSGRLDVKEESNLALPRLPDSPQTGFILRGRGSPSETVDEIIAMPIISTENGEAISAIVLGFTPPALGGAGTGIEDGIWTEGRLVLPTLPRQVREGVAAEMGRTLASSSSDHGGFEFRYSGSPYLLFFKRLNPGSLFPVAYQVSVHPLEEALSRQRQLIWEFSGAGLLAIIAAFLISQFMARRLSEPVERLVVDSKESREHLMKAEAALETTSLELQRSARFSADASHQLKTPVTVLRAGLEELLAGETLSPEAREEASRLVHQTFRLASVIEDLLLLSRMDAGRLKIQFNRLNLSSLLGGLLDDLSAMPDALGLSVESEIPPELWITGEKRYAEIILQNLLENARKYNRAGGMVRIVALQDGEWAVVTIGNTGPAIPKESQEAIFERFHRGAVGENVPGNGIGLNLARELARIHGGELRLGRSDGAWTEFTLRLRMADAASGAP